MTRPAGRSERGPGRRPGPTETRDEILAAARRLFSEKGYDGTSIRAIARAAGVDPALVHHFFDTKERLFVVALHFPIDPSVLVPALLDGPREQLGERMARTFISIWGDPKAREPLLALLRSAVTTEQAATMVREFASSTILAKVAESAGVPRFRVLGAMGQLIGVMMLRYVIKVEPMASADEDELVALLAPVVQHYLDGSRVRQDDAG
jgi:AcrR family transcriptional regulator